MNSICRQIFQKLYYCEHPIPTKSNQSRIKIGNHDEFDYAIINPKAFQYAGKVKFVLTVDSELDGVDWTYTYDS